MGTLTASSTTPNCSKPARRDSSVVCQDRPLLCVSLEFSESRDWICRPDEKFGHFCCVENGDYWGESMLKVDGESWKWVVRGRKKEEGRKKKKKWNDTKNQDVPIGQKCVTVRFWWFSSNYRVLLYSNQLGLVFDLYWTYLLDVVHFHIIIMITPPCPVYNSPD